MTGRNAKILPPKAQIEIKSILQEERTKILMYKVVLT